MSSLNTLITICRDIESQNFLPNNFALRFKKYNKPDNIQLFNGIFMAVVLIINCLLLCECTGSTIPYLYGINLLNMLVCTLSGHIRDNYSKFISYQPTIFEDTVTIKYGQKLYYIEGNFRKLEDGSFKFHKHIKINSSNKTIFQGFVCRNIDGKLGLLSL